MKFKRRVISAAMTAAIAGPACAQSGVSLYGVIDLALSNATGQNNANDKKFSLNQGALSGNRWGLRGTEDLGGGLKASFTLESGFNGDTGSSDQQGQLFGRQAWVGLSGGFGSVTLGRQYGVGFSSVAAYDPLGSSNLADLLGPYGQVGIRFDNSVKYAAHFGPVGVEAMYAFGETAGQFSQKNMTGLGLDYTSGPLTANGFYQISKDGYSRANKAYGIGGTYALQSVKFHAGWVGSKRDAGFGYYDANDAATAANKDFGSAQTNYGFLTSGLTGSTGQIGGNLSANRTDNTYMLGVQYQFDQKMSMLGGAYYTRGKDVAGQGVDGAHNSIFYQVNYAFSKRTDAYVAGAINKVMRGYSQLYSGNNAASNTVVGLRHKF